MTSYENEIENISESGSQSFPSSAVETMEEGSTVSANCPSHPDQNIATQPLTGGPVVIRNYRKTAHYLPLAVLVTFVNFPFGLASLVFSILSRKSSHTGDVENARKYAKISIWLSVIGIAMALVGIIFVLVYLFVISPNIISVSIDLRT